jgi:hypothetical protein
VRGPAGGVHSALDLHCAEKTTVGRIKVGNLESVSDYSAWPRGSGTHWSGAVF